jgi:DNA-binding transcriptional ArsR family regulator
MTQVSPVDARFGGLARRYGILIPASRRYRVSLGLSGNEQLVIDQLLYHYWLPNEWPSMPQSMLAAELGVGRPTLSEQLMRLRRLGFVATRADSRFGTRTPTLFYCLAPYLAVLAMREGVDRYDDALWTEGSDRLLRFADAVEWGTWKWDVDDLETFRAAYSVNTPPRAVAVPLSGFLREEPADSRTPLSVQPTQEESHLYTHTPEGLKTSVLKELKTRALSEGLEVPEASPSQEVRARVSTHSAGSPESSVR